MEKKISIWDNFEISKTLNVGFKLEYIAPKNTGESQIVEIKYEDIESEIEFWKNIIVCYVLGAYPLLR